MSDCVFCKIVAGEIPSFKLYEDDDVLSFMDINPLHDGHCLIIPKQHHPNIFEAPGDVLAKIMPVVGRMARAVNAALSPDGINIMQANGEAAGQSVFHIHFHVLPRVMGDDARINWGLRPGDMDRIAANAEKIRAALAADGE